jgi:hypothetical protein
LQPPRNETSIDRVRLLALAIGVCVFACGPSLTAVHEGSIRFEHCYRLDLDSEVVASHREACWKAWLSSYTYGQPRDRIDYARTRLSELRSGDPTPPSLRTGAEHRPEQRQFYLVVPAPTSVHAPPPPIATVWREGDADAGAVEAPASGAGIEDAGATPPSANCADSCRSDWDECTVKCTDNTATGDAGVSDAGSPACDACKKAYSACMRRCFK